MFDKSPTTEQSKEIDKIVARFIKKAQRSNKETAWQDADRNGMDAVRTYCRDKGLDTLGAHMVRANLALCDAAN